MLFRLQRQDDMLYMVTLPGGEVRYLADGCLALFDKDAAPRQPAPAEPANWHAVIPESCHGKVASALQQLAQNHGADSVRIQLNDANIVPAREIQLIPVRDQDNRVVAITWYGAAPTAAEISYRTLFNRAAVAQWIIDPRPMRQYLEAAGIDSPEAIERRARTEPSFLTNIRELIRISVANPAALELFGASSAKGLQQDTMRDSSDTEILNICHVIMDINSQPARYSHQTEVTIPGNQKKTIWVSCETPALDAIDQGIVMNALDLAQISPSDHEIADREQFLAAILKTLPDILMVFDANRKEPIYQNIDITRVLGYTEKDVRDTNYRILQYITHPDDAMNDEAIRQMYHTLSRGDIFETTLRLQHNNGEWRHFYFRSAALEPGSGDRINNIVVVARDITEVLKTKQILSEQQRHFQLLADNFSDIIITTDTIFRINYVSPSVAVTLGYHPQEFIKRHNAMAVLGLAEHTERLARTLADTVLRGDSQAEDYTGIVETEATRADGSSIPVELKLSILRDEHQLLEGMLIIVRDITERRKIEAAQRLASKVFENSMECIYITDTTGKIAQVNKAFIEVTGYQPADVIGLHPSQLGSGWRNINFNRDIKPRLDSTGYWSGELMSRRSSGEAFLVWMSISRVKDDRGNLLGMITSFRDITEAKSSAESIRKLAYFDPLTDLPNRSLFHDRLRQALQRANRSRRYIAILFMDLDGFKIVNDNLGHAVGDLLLTETGRRLKECIRSDDTVARLGGDEFIIILNALPDRESAETTAAQIATKVIDSLNTPYLLQGVEARIGVSIGISLYPDDSNNEDELIRIADAAMYHAKHSGKNCYQFFTQDMHQRAEQRQEIESDLRKAILADEFVLAFQPKLITHTRQPYGFEALLRWKHPTRGLVAPAIFMRAIDELGIGGKIGAWVIEKACDQLKAWIDAGRGELTMSINIFARQFRDGELVRSVADALARTGIPPQLLTLEFHENLITRDMEFSASILAEIKALGVRVAIDDFGAGMFSLQTLSRLAVDEVKIDRQFIRHMDSRPDQLRLVTTLIGIARNMGMDIVAKGVENKVQLELLDSAGCPRVQGFLFSKPLSEADLQAYLDKTRG